MAEQIDLGASGKFLDRDLSLAITEQVRRLAGPVLREVVDQGLAVFQRCSVTAKGRDEQLGVLFPFLQAIEMLDGVEVLLDAAASVPAQVVLRAAFEALLTVEYVTEQDTERRATAYVVADIHKRMHSLDRFDPDTPPGKQFAAAMAKDKHGSGVTILSVEDTEGKREGYRKLLAEPLRSPVQLQQQLLHSITLTPPELHRNQYKQNL